MSTPSGPEPGRNRTATADAATAESRRATERTSDAARSDLSGHETLPAPAGSSIAVRTDRGTTRIADTVVAKVAGLAARDIPGVYSMGTGMARRVGQLRSLIPGSDTASATQGVAVEVGEREAAIDLDIVTWYGQSIVEVSEAVRRNVTGQVEGMTGLKVVEVNIQIDDIHVETDDQAPKEQRVQ